MTIGTYAVTAVLTLFVIVDPIGLSSLFLGITENYAPEHRKGVARRAVLIAALILLVFMVVGEPLLRYLGVSVDALRIAGGVLLFKVAFDMVMARRERQTHAEEEETLRRHEIAVFPLAIPLIAGPGAFATVLVLVTTADGRWSYLGVLVGSILVVHVLVYAGFRLATPLHRVLGDTGTAVVTRVLGIILAAVSVQLVVDGVTSIMG
jgi:multiple antibiotic resistance protein